MAVSTAPRGMTGWVLLARLVRPQGRKGELIADIFTDFPDRFAAHPRVFLGSGLAAMDAPASSPSQPREAIIERHWLHQGRIVFKFRGVDSINDADTLRGLEVVVPADERVPLEEGAVYIGDLIGCRILEVSSPEEIDIGEVVDVERGLGGAPDLLIVRASSRAAVRASAVASVRPGEALSDGQPVSAITDEPATLRARRGKRARKLPELLIPFAKKYLVSVDTANKCITMRLPAGLLDLNLGAADLGAADPGAADPGPEEEEAG